MHNYMIAPSILSADFARLGEEVDKVVSAGADLIHFDVMDNHYVPNLTMGPMFCQALRNYGIRTDIDVHLMVKPVDNLIEAFAKAGASIISIHPEATEHLDRSLQLIKDCGCRAGIALNPSTPLTYLQYVMDKVDLILLMSVNPGFGGQHFIPGILKKITEVYRLRESSGRQTMRIEVDGGIKTDNIRQIAEAGADTFVAGSAIFNGGDYQKTIAAMREQLNNIKIVT